MTKLIASRGAQCPLVHEFTFNFDDTMANTSGVEKDFGKTNTDATVFEVANLPQGAIVIGGEWVTETAFDALTYTVKVGDSVDDDRYLTATDVKAAARTALVPTGFRGDGENIRITVTAADVCTAGKATLRVQFVIANRVNEVYPS